MARSMDNQTNSLSFELERGRIMGSSFRLFSSISQRHSSFGSERDRDDEYELKWAAIERLSTVRRMRTSVLDQTVSGDEEQKEKKVVDVAKLGALERRLFVEKLIKHIENDNLRLLQKLYFPTRFPQNLWVQFKACLWKLSLSYWRNPSYNLVRMIFIFITSVVFSALFIADGLEERR